MVHRSSSRTLAMTDGIYCTYIYLQPRSIIVFYGIFSAFHLLGFPVIYFLSCASFYWLNMRKVGKGEFYLSHSFRIKTIDKRSKNDRQKS